MTKGIANSQIDKKIYLYIHSNGQFSSPIKIYGIVPKLKILEIENHTQENFAELYSQINVHYGNKPPGNRYITPLKSTFSKTDYLCLYLFLLVVLFAITVVVIDMSQEIMSSRLDQPISMDKRR